MGEPNYTFRFISCIVPAVFVSMQNGWKTKTLEETSDGAYFLQVVRDDFVLEMLVVYDLPEDCRLVIPELHTYIKLGDRDEFLKVAEKSEPEMTTFWNGSKDRFMDLDT